MLEILKVCEIFVSIQGESSYTGFPCVFVRLSGCNLHCRYCDTIYARKEYLLMSLSDVIAQVEAKGFRLVEITGGEPLLQEATPILVKEMLNRGYQVLVETNGSLSIDMISKGAIRIVDFKCPSSGMMDYNDYDNIYRLVAGHDEVKFVIGNREDYSFALDLRKRILESGWYGTINFSPVFGELEPRELAEWILRDKLDVRLNLQLHKYIWRDIERGV
ncbi:MAG: radical SAM protein [Syntrophobacterales bacterium]|nr:radical SAM protein [Syntrophobacterales bacterium]